MCGSGFLLNDDPLRVVAAGVGLGFDQDELSVVVGQSPIRFAVGVLVVGRGLERARFIGFPGIDASVAIGVLLDASQLVRFVEFPSIDGLLVASGGNLDAADGAIGIRKAP
jgi:hypothetical protein